MERKTIKEIEERVIKAAIQLLSIANMAGAPLGKTAAEIAKAKQPEHNQKDQS